MATLNVTTGLKEYDINGKVTVLINPTDPTFMERLYDMLIALEKKDDEYRIRKKTETDAKKLFELAREMDSEMREMINGTLGQDVCDPVFGSVNMYAIADGLPLWANLLLAIIEEMDGAFEQEKKISESRIKKYTTKFNKAG